MNASTYGAEALLTKALRAAAEAFLATLDEATGGIAKTGSEDDELIEYDPLHDQPPFSPSPKEGATETQKRMAYVTYLGSIGRLNAEQGRGAVSKEISEFAKKAGYMGGNAVNGWNSRANSPRAVEIEDGARFLNEEGLKWITNDAKKLGIKLVGEFKTVPAPKK